MGSSSKRRQTMAKMARERTLQERRELKQQKKDEKKQAAAAARDSDGNSDADGQLPRRGDAAPVTRQTSTARQDHRAGPRCGGGNLVEIRRRGWRRPRF